jgi:hypothetical protein
MAGYKGITVNNNGGFVMEFDVLWAGPTPTHSTASSGRYPLGSNRSIDMSTGTYNIQPGQTMQPHVHAILGDHKDGSFVTYDPAGPFAVYTCSGTVRDIHLTLQS